MSAPTAPEGAPLFEPYSSMPPASAEEATTLQKATSPLAEEPSIADWNNEFPATELETERSTRAAKIIGSVLTGLGLITVHEGSVRYANLLYDQPSILERVTLASTLGTFVTGFGITVVARSKMMGDICFGLFRGRFSARQSVTDKELGANTNEVSPAEVNEDLPPVI